MEMLLRHSPILSAEDLHILAYKATVEGTHCRCFRQGVCDKPIPVGHGLLKIEFPYTYDVYHVTLGRSPKNTFTPLTFKPRSYFVVQYDYDRPVIDKKDYTWIDTVDWSRVNLSPTFSKFEWTLLPETPPVLLWNHVQKLIESKKWIVHARLVHRFDHLENKALFFWATLKDTDEHYPVGYCYTIPKIVLHKVLLHANLAACAQEFVVR